VRKGKIENCSMALPSGFLVMELSWANYLDSCPPFVQKCKSINLPQ